MGGKNVPSISEARFVFEGIYFRVRRETYIIIVIQVLIFNKSLDVGPSDFVVRLRVFIVGIIGNVVIGAIIGSAENSFRNIMAGHSSVFWDPNGV